MRAVLFGPMVLLTMDKVPRLSIPPPVPASLPLMLLLTMDNMPRLAMPPPVPPGASLPRMVLDSILALPLGLI